MEQNLESTVALLARTPAALDALLRGLPDAWTRANEGDNTMSPFDVIAHLVQSEKENWIPRARMILHSGQSVPFPPFDRWAGIRASQSAALGDLLDQFARLRTESLSQLRALHLQPADFDRRGLHPALGPVTLSQLLSAWVGHDLTHLHQMSRVLAHQYRESVGKWSNFLGVMHCTGHSAQA
ncbi:MAG TPA: DinB family protein [Terracidiphilus sp.]|jgi:hypothetical protein